MSKHRRGCVHYLWITLLGCGFVFYALTSIVPSTASLASNRVSAVIQSVQNIAIAQAVTPTAIVLTNADGLSFEIEGFQRRSSAGTSRPRNDTYLVLFATLHNDTSRSRCIFARDVRLVMQGVEYAPDRAVMDKIQNALIEKRDYIGPVLGQCVNARASEPTFVAFDIPLPSGNATLVVGGRSRQIPAEMLGVSTTRRNQAPTATRTRVTATATSTRASTVDSAQVRTETAIAEELERAILGTLSAEVATSRASSTPRSSPTLRPTRTPTQTYYTTARANARECQQLNCRIILTLDVGTAVEVRGSTTGASVSGSDAWYQVRYNGQTVYIHSSLLSRTPVASAPRPTQAPVQQVQPPPVSQPISTPVPAAPQPAGPQFTCNCSKTCEQMVSCEEAYFQLNQCGCRRRDADNDGVPCENICLGG